MIEPIDLSYKKCRSIASSTFDNNNNTGIYHRNAIKKCIKQDNSSQTILPYIHIVERKNISKYIINSEQINDIYADKYMLCSIAGLLIARTHHGIDYNVLVNEYIRSYILNKYKFDNLYIMATVIYNLFSDIVDKYIEYYYKYVIYEKRSIYYTKPYVPLESCLL